MSRPVQNLIGNVSQQVSALQVALPPQSALVPAEINSPWRPEQYDLPGFDFARASLAPAEFFPQILKAFQQLREQNFVVQRPEPEFQVKLHLAADLQAMMKAMHFLSQRSEETCGVLWKHIVEMRQGCFVLNENLGTFFQEANLNNQFVQKTFQELASTIQKLYERQEAVVHHGLPALQITASAALKDLSEGTNQAFAHHRGAIEQLTATCASFQNLLQTHEEYFGHARREFDELREMHKSLERRVGVLELAPPPHEASSHVHTPEDMTASLDQIHTFLKDLDNRLYALEKARHQHSPPEPVQQVSQQHHQQNAFSAPLPTVGQANPELRSSSDLFQVNRFAPPVAPLPTPSPTMGGSDTRIPGGVEPGISAHPARASFFLYSC